MHLICKTKQFYLPHKRDLSSFQIFSFIMAVAILGTSLVNFRTPCLLQICQLKKVGLARKKVFLKNVLNSPHSCLFHIRGKKNDTSHMLLAGGVSLYTHIHAPKRAPYSCQISLLQFSQTQYSLSPLRSKKRNMPLQAMVSLMLQLLTQPLLLRGQHLASPFLSRSSI